MKDIAGAHKLVKHRTSTLYMQARRNWIPSGSVGRPPSSATPSSRNRAVGHVHVARSGLLSSTNC
jgi:hypothetical protein